MTVTCVWPIGCTSTDIKGRRLCDRHYQAARISGDLYRFPKPFEAHDRPLVYVCADPDPEPVLPWTGHQCRTCLRLIVEAS